MEVRKHHMKETCKLFNKNEIGKKRNWNFLFSSEHELAMCDVYKSGSSRYQPVFNQRCNDNKQIPNY